MIVRPTRVRGIGEADVACAWHLAVPVNQIPSSSVEAGGWVLLGGLDPLEVGSFDILLPQDPAGCEKLCLKTLEQAGPRVHLFRRTDTGWLPLGFEGEWVLPVERHVDCLVLSAVVELEGAQRSDAGRCPPRGFRLEVVRRAADGTVTDRVHAHFRIPPVLLASSADPVEALWVIRNFKSEPLVTALEGLAPELGVALEVLEFPPDLQEIVLAPERANAAHRDVWMQDAVALGKICVPGTQGPEQGVAAVAGVRSLYPGMDYARLDASLRALLRARDAVVMDPGLPRAKVRGIDWYGNLQVSPPGRDHQGRAFPHGRIITGVKGPLGMHPGVLDLLESQGVQTPPLRIDTSWLGVGHVDEVLAFVPVGERGDFRVLVPSPAAARSILQRLVDWGQGDLAVFPGRKEETTVAALLRDVAETEESDGIEESLLRLRAELGAGLGISPAQFLELPALFRQGKAVIPNPVNCLVCNGHVLVPVPEGPVVGGTDVFALDIRSRLESLGKKVHFLDVWESLHTTNGGIHCATNTVRRLANPAWWAASVPGESLFNEP